MTYYDIGITKWIHSYFEIWRHEIFYNEEAWCVYGNLIERIVVKGYYIPV